MILPALICKLQNDRSNLENHPNPLVLGCYVSFNGCRASLMSPFLPVVESVGFSLLVRSS
jgi:hypothetical protein